MSKKRDPNQVQLFELDRQNKILKTVVFGFVLIAVAVILFVVVDGLQNQLHSSLMKQVLSDIATTTFSLAIVGLAFEYFNRENNDRQLSSSIVNAIILSNKVLQRLSEESKYAYILNLLRVLLGEGRGDALYQAYVQPFEQHRVDTMFRSSFKYDISFLSPADASSFAVSGFGPYMQVVEELEYEKYFPSLAQMKHHQFYIVSALREEDLRPYFGDLNCIYRNVLNLHDDDMLRVTAAEDPIDLLRSLYRVNVRMNDQDVGTRLVYEEGVFKVLLDTEAISSGDNNIHFYISVETVQRREQNFYSVYITEPSKSPEISFHYSPAMTNVHFSSYFSGIHSTDIREWRTDKVRTITLKVINNKWVFPTSGVVFIWSQRGDTRPSGEQLIASAPQVMQSSY